MVKAFTFALIAVATISSAPCVLRVFRRCLLGTFLRSRLLGRLYVMCKTTLITVFTVSSAFELRVGRRGCHPARRMVKAFTFALIAVATISSAPVRSKGLPFCCRLFSAGAWAGGDETPLNRMVKAFTG